MFSYIRMFTPMLLHYGISIAVSLLLKEHLDASGMAALIALITIPIAFFLWKKEGNGCMPKEKKITMQRLLLLCIICAVLGASMNYIFSTILNSINVEEVFSNEVQENLLSSAIVFQIIGLGFLVPLAEELIFRGLMYNRMKRFFSVNVSIFASALLFALYHGNPIQIIFAFPMALILAYVYEKSGTFLCPLSFHIGSNLLAVVLNLFG